MTTNRFLGYVGTFILMLFVLGAIYAPLLASSKPLWVIYRGEIYFPLARYLFFSGFYTKPLDIFFNLLMFFFPLMLLSLRRWRWAAALGITQLILFVYLAFYGIQDPSLTPPYARLNKLIEVYLRQQHHEKLAFYAEDEPVSSRWSGIEKYLEEKKRGLAKELEARKEEYYKEVFLQSLIPGMAATPEMKAYAEHQKTYSDLLGEEKWLTEELPQLSWVVMPLVRPFHWEEDAGGSKGLNARLPWTELTRSNRKDLTAALFFGARIALVVGALSVGIALLIGVPVGALSGYYGGKLDLIVCRLLEVWESMPVFFMLLLIVAILQTKNIFIVIFAIGLFGWTAFSRYTRGEFLKQRSLPYVESCKAIGLPERRIIFSHILPNAIAPVVTLLPFAMMGAITSEAGLSFLGLGEEGSCSWGCLMDEGRNAFPEESYLLWPPAIFLTLLLISIALIGDRLRETLDPRS